jgi:hypothetical protein
MNKYLWNAWNTTPLTLNVMEACARHVGQDINDNEVSDKLYWICYDLELWPEDHGFGSSDHYNYFKAAEKAFNQEQAA